MKKLFTVAFTLFLSINFYPAHADTPVVRIVDTPHTNFDGSFIDNKLAQELTSGGKLGKLIYSERAEVTWVIDAALIDEIIDMSNGYTFNKKEDLVGQNAAQAFLNRLSFITVGDPIVALPYGNPDAAAVRAISPGELDLYSKVAQAKLESYFGKPVISQNGWGIGRSRLDIYSRARYRENRAIIAGLSRNVKDPEISQFRVRLGRLFNPLLNSKERTYFSTSAIAESEKITSKLRVVSGRYQLTSQSVKVPITLINNFDTATTLNLSLIPMNSRVQVENINNVLIPPHSRIQLSVPFRVIAPGNVIVKAQFMTPKGEMVGVQSKLNLSLTVIDSRVAWFTTAAGVALFLGAVAQSVRRFKRGRHEK